jgi:hypothetical protein
MPRVRARSRLNEFAQADAAAFALKSWAGWSSIKSADSYVKDRDNRETADRFFKSKLMVFMVGFFIASMMAHAANAHVYLVHNVKQMLNTALYSAKFDN